SAAVNLNSNQDGIHLFDDDRIDPDDSRPWRLPPLPAGQTLEKRKFFLFGNLEKALQARCAVLLSPERRAPLVRHRNALAIKPSAEGLRPGCDKNEGQRGPYCETNDP